MLSSCHSDQLGCTLPKIPASLHLVPRQLWVKHGQPMNKAQTTSLIQCLVVSTEAAGLAPTHSTCQALMQLSHQPVTATHQTPGTCACGWHP